MYERQTIPALKPWVSTGKIGCESFNLRAICGSFRVLAYLFHTQRI